MPAPPGPINSVKTGQAAADKGIAWKKEELRSQRKIYFLML